jgi:hypothetical protein
MNKFFLLILSIFIVGCSTSRYVPYNPTSKDVEAAKVILEDLTWSQHLMWRPDNFQITDTFIGWDYGITSDSKTRGRSVGVGVSKQFKDSGIGLGVSGTSNNSRTTTVIRETIDRTYYRSINDVKLVSWKKNFKQWYIVRLMNSNRSQKNVLRTRSIDDAKLYIDALTTIIEYSKNISPINTVDEAQQSLDNVTNEKESDIYSELMKLDELRKNGILTESEFTQEKQKILNRN